LQELLILLVVKIAGCSKIQPLAKDCASGTNELKSKISEWWQVLAKHFLSLDGSHCWFDLVIRMILSSQTISQHPGHQGIARHGGAA
jgi:hypothetical protein